MSAPTPVSALVHSSTLVAAGVYMLLMIPTREGLSFLRRVSLFSIYLSSFSALVEIDFKRIVALSTLSQISIILYAASTGITYLAFFHLLTHAVTKAGLFVVVGHYLMQGSQDTRRVSSIAPVYGVLMLLCSLSLIGFPFLSCFYSKEPMGLFIPLILTRAYSIRLLLVSHTWCSILVPIFKRTGLFY